MNLRQWVKKNWDQVELLSAATQQYRPGVILHPQTNEIRAAAWRLVGESKDDPFWKTIRTPGLLAEQEFHEERQSGVLLKIPGIVSVSLKTQSRIAASCLVESVEAEMFEDTFEADIQKKLRDKLKETPTWRDFVDNHRVVWETWYVRKLKITFASEGQLLAQADVEQKVSISASGNRQWDADHVFTVESDGTVPFGVRTFRP